MSPDKKKLLAAIKVFVTGIFNKQINDFFLFHNIHHTIDVVNSAKKIADNYKLEKDDHFALIAASWFHDTGFNEGKIENHEAKSKAIAKSFLKGKVSDITLEKIISCIQATRMPQTPENTIEKIICDADLYHLGTYKFKTYSNLLKQEKEIYFNKNISEIDWIDDDTKFLETHKYFTKYCRKRLEPVKQKWLHKYSRVSK